jgi:hypothetical protein
VSFSPGLLAIAKALSKPTDQFKFTNQGFVVDCFLCTPQYVFEDCDKIHYAIKSLKSADSSTTLTDVVMGTQNAAEMLFSEDLLKFPVDEIDMVYLNRVTGHPPSRVPRFLKTYVDAQGITW